MPMKVNSLVGGLSNRRLSTKAQTNPASQRVEHNRSVVAREAGR